jgi:hypothetical protein
MHLPVFWCDGESHFCIVKFGHLNWELNKAIYEIAWKGQGLESPVRFWRVDAGLVESWRGLYVSIFVFLVLTWDGNVGCRMTEAHIVGSANRTVITWGGSWRCWWRTHVTMTSMTTPGWIRWLASSGLRLDPWPSCRRRLGRRHSRELTCNFGRVGTCLLAKYARVFALGVR